MGLTPRLHYYEYSIETMTNNFMISGANLVNNSSDSPIYYGNKASVIVYSNERDYNSSDDLQLNYRITRIVCWYTKIHSVLHK